MRNRTTPRRARRRTKELVGGPHAISREGGPDETITSSTPSAGLATHSFPRTSEQAQTIQAAPSLFVRLRALRGFVLHPIQNKHVPLESAAVVLAGQRL